MMTPLERIKKASENRKKIQTIGDAYKFQDIDPDNVLASAFGKVNDVVLMGYDKEGELYLASSVSDGGDILWLIEQLKIKLLDI